MSDNNNEPTFDAWAVYNKGEEFKPFTYTPRPLGPNDVEIKITHCGICYSDIHQIDSGWGESMYPIVPGHEIVGEVTSVGSDVTKFKVGQRAGVGPQCWSCGTCNFCDHHQEVYCEEIRWTYNDMYPDMNMTYGGYAKNIRVDARFVFSIPDNLPSDRAAPLLCAGVTTFQPLKQHGIAKGMRLGVVGVGGLGHMAIKWGKAFGCHVIAFSHTDNKKNDALALGADEFVNTSEKGALRKYKRSLDAVINSVSATLPWSDYFMMVKPFGKFICVGLPEQTINLRAFDLIGTDIALIGSQIGSPARIEEMLQFASQHNILSDVQVWPIDKVNEAIQEVRQGKPHFRYVLSM